MKALVNGFASFVILVTASTSPACFRTPLKGLAKLSERQKEVFIFHDGENAHMVIRTTLNAEKFPHEVAWLLPVPTLPLKYEEVDGPVFMELQQTSNFPKREELFGGGRGIAKPKSYGAAMKVLDPAVVGQFKIQPIEILSDDSNREVNAWLKKNGFAGLSKTSQKAYLKKGAYFLAIRMEMNHPDEKNLVSRALHVVYKADKMPVPLALDQDSKDFQVSLFVFSKQELKKELSDSHWTRYNSKAYENKHMTPMVDHLIASEKGYFTYYEGSWPEAKAKDFGKDPVFTAAELN